MYGSISADRENLLEHKNKSTEFGYRSNETKK
jgi:hypothetical protein